MKKILTALLCSAAILASTAVAGNTSFATLPTPVAYVGCSVSELSVHGYHIDGGTRMWPQNSKYDSGFVSTWAGSLTNRWWTAFNQMNLQYPGAQQVWWQLCVATNTDPAQLDHDARIVLQRIHDKLPGATVYVSSLPPYPDHLCPTTGTDGIINGENERNLLTQTTDAQPGPVMVPLDLKHVYPYVPCHPNYRGQQDEGRVLLNFFDPPTAISERQCAPNVAHRCLPCSWIVPC